MSAEGSDLRDGLDCANFVVRCHDRDEDRVGADRRLKRADANASLGIDRQEADLKSFDKGVASVTLAGNAVEMAADPAVSTLKPSKVMIGIRPRAFTAESSASTCVKARRRLMRRKNPVRTSAMATPNVFAPLTAVVIGRATR